MKRLCQFLLLILPTLLIITWHSQRNDYPHVDGADYTLKAQLTYKTFKIHGVTKGLSYLFTNRGWKPTSNPIAILPGLFIGNGSARFSFLFTTALFHFLFVIGLYSIFILYIRPWPAVSATLFIGSMPWLMNSALELYPEGKVLALTTLSFAFLLRSDFLRDKKYSLLAGVCIGCSLSLRPALGVLQFCLPLLFILYQNRSKDLAPLKSFTYALTPLFFGVGILIYSLVTKQEFETGRALILFAILVLLIAAPYILDRGHWNKGLAIGLHAATFIPVIWFITHFNRLFNYLYAASFGQIAVETGGRQGVSFISQFWRVVSGMTGVFGAFLVIFFCVALYFLKPKIKDYILRSSWSHLALFALLSFAPIVFIGGLSSSSEIRYYGPHFILVWVSFLVLFFKLKPIKVFLLRTIILIGLFQISYFGSRLLSDMDWHYRVQDIFGSDYYFFTREAYSSTLIPNDLLDYLSSREPRRGWHKVGVLPFRYGAPITDANRMNLIASDKNKSIFFRRPYFKRYDGNLDDHIQSIKENYDFILVGPLEYGPEPIWHARLSQLALKIMERYKQDPHILGHPGMSFRYSYSDWKGSFLLIEVEP